LVTKDNNGAGFRPWSGKAAPTVNNQQPSQEVGSQKLVIGS